MTSEALFLAVSSCKLKHTQFLLNSGASTEFTDQCGQTALIKAIFIENSKIREKMVCLLLHHNANCNHIDDVGRSALSWACMFGQEEEVTMILECSNLDLNSPDVSGQTPLYHAVTSANAAIVKKMVLALKADDLSVDLKDNNGISPLMHAIRLGYDICASILTIQGGAKCGIGMKYPDNFFNAQKWANKSLFDKKLLQKRKSNFPPIPLKRAFVTVKSVRKSMNTDYINCESTCISPMDGIDNYSSLLEEHQATSKCDNNSTLDKNSPLPVSNESINTSSLKDSDANITNQSIIRPKSLNGVKWYSIKQDLLLQVKSQSKNTSPDSNKVCSENRTSLPLLPVKTNLIQNMD